MKCEDDPKVNNCWGESRRTKLSLKQILFADFLRHTILQWPIINFNIITRVLRGTLCCAAVGNISAAFQCLIFAEAKKQHYLMIFTSAWSLEVMEYFSHSSWASSVGEDAVQPRESGLAVSAENYVTFQQLWLIFEVTKVTIRTQFHSQSVA